jgi:hypothetical protein
MLGVCSLPQENIWLYHEHLGLPCDRDRQPGTQVSPFACRILHPEQPITDFSFDQESGVAEKASLVSLFTNAPATIHFHESIQHNEHRLFLSQFQVWLQPNFCPQNKIIQTRWCSETNGKPQITEVISALCHSTT